MSRDSFWRDASSALYLGDAHDVLAGMPDGSVDCIVTSPPYWGKRDYGVIGQYGRESDPAAYVATLRDVFAEARRVLADDGTCWLNLGDRDEQAVMDGLAQRGVLVRGGRALGSDAPALRVTYGLPEDNRRFLDALAEVL